MPDPTDDITKGYWSSDHQRQVAFARAIHPLGVECRSGVDTALRHARNKYYETCRKVMP